MKRQLTILFLLLSMTLSAMAQKELTVTGRVTDTNGEELIGVSVIVKGAKGLGTITNFNGEYSIKVQEFSTLVFTYIGIRKCACSDICCARIGQKDFRLCRRNPSAQSGRKAYGLGTGFRWCPSCDTSRQCRCLLYVVRQD